MPQPRTRRRALLFTGAALATLVGLAELVAYAASRLGWGDFDWEEILVRTLLNGALVLWFVHAREDRSADHRTVACLVRRAGPAGRPGSRTANRWRLRHPLVQEGVLVFPDRMSILFPQETVPAVVRVTSVEPGGVRPTGGAGLPGRAVLTGVAVLTGLGARGRTVTVRGPDGDFELRIRRQDVARLDALLSTEGRAVAAATRPTDRVSGR